MNKQYIVGGAIRDVLLGSTPKDLDYVWVQSTPEHMVSLGMSQVGADFPVFLDKDGNEHALARTERKVGVGYNGFETNFDSTVTLKDDLVRRDLTMNAMAVHVEEWDEFVKTKNSDLVIDFFGGLEDLASGNLRHVSDAFAEDPVRVLRVARFAARYNFSIDPSTLNLMCVLVHNGELDHLVPERVWAEMEKAVSEDFPGDFFAPLADIGALEVLMPELDYGMMTDSNLTRASTMPATGSFAALFANSTISDIDKMCDRLKAPNDVRKLAVKTRKLLELCLFNLTEDGVMNTFEQMGLFQEVYDTIDAIQVCNVLVQNELTGFTDNLHTLTRLWKPLSEVRFANLTEEQQLNLKGPAVGQALRTLRLNTVFNALT